MAKSKDYRIAMLSAAALYGLLNAPAGFALSEQDLRIATPCKPASSAATAQATNAFEQRYGKPYATHWIDVNGDGRCDLVIDYQPSGDDRRNVSEFFVVPGVDGGLAHMSRWRPAGDGTNAEAVLLRGSSIPFLVTRDRNGFRHVLRWDPQADMPSKSAFRVLHLDKGALMILGDDDHDVNVVRRFLAQRYISQGLKHLDSDKYIAAVAALNEADSIHTQSAEIQHHLGVAKSKAGVHVDTQYERGANWHLSQAIKRGIDDPKSAHYHRELASETHLQLAKSFEATHNAAGAIASYNKFAALEPKRRVEVESRITGLKSANPIFAPPPPRPKMAEELRVLRLDLPKARPVLAQPATAQPPKALPDAALQMPLHVRPIPPGVAAPPAPAKPAPNEAATRFNRDPRSVKAEPTLPSAPAKAANVTKLDAAHAPANTPTATRTTPIFGKPTQLETRPAASADHTKVAAPAAAPAPALKPPATKSASAPAPAAVATTAAPKPITPAPKPTVSADAARAPAIVALANTRPDTAATVVKPSTNSAGVTTDKNAAIRRELIAESEKQKRRLTTEQIEALVQYRNAHPNTPIAQLVANPDIATTKPLAVRGTRAITARP